VAGIKKNKRADDSGKLMTLAGAAIKAALAEDVGTGDITTAATVARSKKGVCRIMAKEDLVLAGIFIAEEVFKILDEKIIFTALAAEGTKVKKGHAIAELRGPLRPLLTGERLALNFLQRLSGIATLTEAFVKKAKEVKILDTRKTTPGMRAFERYAVRMGGGMNHRYGLFDAVLIKDNHIKAAGGLIKAVKKVKKKLGTTIPIEVEVTTITETKEALAAGADRIMLDNMSPAKIKKILKIIGGKAATEASGGINIANIEEYAATGVDFISIGALTHSAPAVDISMKVTGGDAPKRR